MTNLNTIDHMHKAIATIPPQSAYWFFWIKWKVPRENVPVRGYPHWNGIWRSPLVIPALCSAALPTPDACKMESWKDNKAYWVKLPKVKIQYPKLVHHQFQVFSQVQGKVILGRWQKMEWVTTTLHEQCIKIAWADVEPSTRMRTTLLIC